MSHRVEVPEVLVGQRVDRAVAELLDIPVNAARRLCEAGRVRVQGRRARKGDVMGSGATLEVQGEVRGQVQGQTCAWLVPAAPQAPLAVLFEDDDVLVADKPPGIPSHPLVPGEGGTLVDLLVATHPEVAAASEHAREGGLVHRLDTGTSGCIAVARHRDAWRALRATLSAGEVHKTYLALVHGRWSGPDDVQVHAPLSHHPRDTRRMIVVPPGDASGQDAQSRVRVRAAVPGFILVEVTVDVGRRHQVRAHLAHLGHPLVGDVLYGAPPADDADWHMLHAHTLRLPGRPLVTAPVPPAFALVARARGLEGALPSAG